MTNVEYRNSLYELSEIFKVLDKNLIAKLPQGLIDMIENGKSEDYDFSLDQSKSLKEQNLSETTQLFLTTLLLKYWSNEEEKQEVFQAMRENEEKYQEQLREEYNPNNLFKHDVNTVVTNNDIQEQSSSEPKEMIKYKESFWKRIINKFKSLFKKK